jgi:hypothetical protein
VRVPLRRGAGCGCWCSIWFHLAGAMGVIQNKHPTDVGGMEHRNASKLAGEGTCPYDGLGGRLANANRVRLYF